MFDTVAMSRLAVAAPVDRMEEVLRSCMIAGCVHVETYSNFEDGINVGSAISTDAANEVSAMLSKVRAAVSAFNPVNGEGPLNTKRVEELLNGAFPETLQKGLDTLDVQRDTEAEIDHIEEQLHLLGRLLPLGMELDLLKGSGHVEVYVSETPRASKARSVFGDLLQKVELMSAARIVAVACLPSDSAEVQMALGELGGKAVQIPTIEGSPGEAIASLRARLKKAENTLQTAEADAKKWVDVNGRNLLAVHEHLAREDEIFTAPTQIAVTNQAFALDAWVPTDCVLYRFIPRSITETDMELVWYVNGDAEEGTDYNKEDLTWLWHHTTLEDEFIITRNSEGVNSQFFEPGPFHPEHESTLNEFVTWYLKGLSQVQAS